MKVIDIHGKPAKPPGSDDLVMIRRSTLENLLHNSNLFIQMHSQAETALKEAGISIDDLRKRLEKLEKQPRSKWWR